jgi:hypothetical protein
MPTFLDDLDAIDPNAVEQTGPAYPVAQWLNGDPKLAAVGGVVHTGGLIMPTKYLDDNLAPPPGWTRTHVAFSSGKSEQMMACPKPKLAVIRTRFRWFVIYNGVTTFYPRAGYVADAGMRGHIQALCGVHGFDFPVVVTFKGKASQEFERLLREFSQKTQDAAHRLLAAKDPKARFPRFAFYMRLAPGPHVKVGQKGQESIVTSPTLELPAELTQDYLGKVYVGREALVAFQQVYHDAADWGAAWDRAGAEESDEAAEHDEPPSARANPATGEITARSNGVDFKAALRRDNPANLADDDFFFGDAPEAEPEPAKKKPATLSVTSGSRWIGMVKALVKAHPHYADAKGLPNNHHILYAAAAEGFAEINNGNMEIVIEALANRVNG